MEQGEKNSAVRVGMQRGVFGGVVAFLVSLLGPVAGMLAAIFVGISLGWRAAAADAEGAAERHGALSGLVGAAVAAPVFLFGAAAGSLVAARGAGTTRMAETLSGMLGTAISPEQAWQLFLISLVFAAVVQAAILIGAAAASGAWSTRKG